MTHRPATDGAHPTTHASPPFHPLVFFYALGLLIILAGLLLGAVEAILRLQGNEITTPTIVLVALLLISGSQFTLFAMWFDMESNKELR